MVTSFHALVVRGLRKAYGDVVAVDGLDLGVAAGECFGLLGPNGAGKTTTVEICEGILERDSGDLEVLGMTWEKDATALRERLGEESGSARLLADRAIQVAAGRADPVAVAERRVTEAGSRYIDFVVPGLLGMNLMGSGIWGLAFAIVDARGKKLLKRFMATPMSRVEYLLSFFLSRLVFLVLEVVTLVGVGVFVFGVPLRGSIIGLTVICLLSAFAFGGLGLLISSRATTVEGVSGLTNFVMLPMWIFSGVFFASSNFPDFFQPLIQALPLTAVNDALRANMLEGESLASVGGELSIIAAWMVVSFIAALKLFRWR